MGSINNNNNNGGSTSLHRKSTTTKRVEQELAASALRKAIQSSDPQLFSDSPPHRLPLKDRFMEKKKFIFYQDEGGFMASDDSNQPLPVIYYLGIIDILFVFFCLDGCLVFVDGDRVGVDCWGLCVHTHSLSCWLIQNSVFICQEIRTLLERNVS
jgi:hypothetical protein